MPLDTRFDELLVELFEPAATSFVTPRTAPRSHLYGRGDLAGVPIHAMTDQPDGPTALCRPKEVILGVDWGWGGVTAPRGSHGVR